jgi:hypothetical protein
VRELHHVVVASGLIGPDDGVIRAAGRQFADALDDELRRGGLDHGPSR